ncbi:DUF4232 domain-containing protein [Streptomyces roseoviridis]|uniref:DUF4232 domain-containing protein n=1 Tax=Streptomyces roseoviridis TaxID=67361 RepID=A0ABV5QSS5_9ACTN
MNTHTPAGKSWAVGAAVIAALLGATACGPDAAGDAATAAPSDRASASSSARPGGSAPATPDATASPKPSATSDGSGGTGGNGTGAGNGAACTTEHLAVSAVKEPADSKEARHLLITVQNTGDTTCELYRHPLVRLGAEARTTVPVIKDSDPDPGKPVALAPGDEAHAALLVSGGARDEYEAKSISLTLQGGKPGSRLGEPVEVPMPVSTLYADDGQLVTYWTTASGFALDFVVSK